MGGLFGGGSKSKSSGEKKSTTAESIETADGTVYDRRGTAAAADASPKTSPVASMAEPVQPMGAAPAGPAQPGSKTMETVLPGGTDASRKRRSGTLAGGTYGFG